jgi:hypothetical protein
MANPIPRTPASAPQPADSLTDEEVSRGVAAFLAAEQWAADRWAALTPDERDRVRREGARWLVEGLTWDKARGPRPSAATLQEQVELLAKA